MADPQIPYSVQSIFTFPPDDGKPNADRCANLSGNYTKVASHKLTLSGTGTHTVGFGTIAAPGAKGFLLEYNNDDAQAGLQPVNVTINGGSDTWEISPGGHLAYSNPNPASGITAMDIAHTSEARINIWILG